MKVASQAKPKPITLKQLAIFRHDHQNKRKDEQHATSAPSIVLMQGRAVDRIRL